MGNIYCSSMLLLLTVVLTLTGCAAGVGTQTTTTSSPVVSNKPAAPSDKRSNIRTIKNERVFKLVVQARSSIDAGKFEEARKALNDALALDRQCFDVHYYLAEVAYKTDHFDEALQSAQRAVDCSSKDPDGLLLLCWLQLNTDKLKELGPNVDRCLLLVDKPDQKAQLLSWKAYAARKNAKWREAAESAEQVKKLAPDKPELWVELYYDYFQQGRVEEARAFLRDCINKYPKHASGNEWMKALSQLDSMSSTIDEEGARWSEKQMPLKVFVSNHGVAFTENEHFHTLILESFGIWANASGGKITFKPVTDESNSDISVKFTNSPLEVAMGDDHCAGLTKSVKSRDYTANRDYVKKAEIVLMAFVPNTSTAITDAELKHVALHEIGHAIGLKHSGNPDDTMFPTENKDFSVDSNPVLTNNDLTQLGKLYR